MGMEQRQQDAHAPAPEGRQVVGRQAAHLARRGVQPHRRPSERDHGSHRPDGCGQRGAVDPRARPLQRGDHAEDAGLAVHRRDPQPPVHRSAARLVEGVRSGDIPELESRRLRTVRQDLPLHDAGLRLREEPELLAGGPPEGVLPRVRAGRVERQRARADPERSGRLDAQLRPERRTGVRVEGSEALPRVLCDRCVPDLPPPRRHAVSVQPRRLPEGAQPRDRPELGLEARRVRLRAAHRCARAPVPLPELGDRRVRQGAGEGDGHVQPDRGEEDAHRRRVHVQGQQPHRPEGQPGLARHPRDLGLV